MRAVARDASLVEPRRPRVSPPGNGEPGARRPHYLPPGQLVACSEPTAVTTILGSCAAVCLWDRRRAVGGVNHYLLPDWTGPREFSPRFGPVAMEQLLARMRSLGCQDRDLEAKLFGGAKILGGGGSENHLGLQNAAVARAQLAASGITLVAEDVGGDRGRKLVFFTDTGVALVRKL
jgi:chemotaxis protein CheD